MITSHYLKNGPTPASYWIIFGLFKQTLLQFLQQINVKKCHVHPVYGAGIRTPWPLEHEPPPITTRPLFAWKPNDKNAKQAKNNNSDSVRLFWRAQIIHFYDDRGCGFAVKFEKRNLQDGILSSPSRSKLARFASRCRLFALPQRPSLVRLKAGKRKLQRAFFALRLSLLKPPAGQNLVRQKGQSVKLFDKFAKRLLMHQDVQQRRGRQLDSR